LTEGPTFDWKEGKINVEYVKDHGILQFLAIYHKFKDVEDYKHLWGDEVEFIIAEFNEEGKSVHLSTRGYEVLTKLEAEQGKVNECSWRPEYGVYMVEAVPGGPYSEQYSSLLMVEKNMAKRRSMIQEKLNRNETVLAMSHFPRLGCPGFFRHEKCGVKGEIANSLFVPDEIINPHRRFATLTNNIMTRKGKNVIINVPLFQDKNTKSPDYSKLFPGVDPSQIPAKADHIYADAMAFGMGMCCSQVTFQTKNLAEGLLLYDHLLPLGPIMLALTASTPILRGYLSDIDVRWPIIEASVDDRTDEELKTIERSRYGPASCYLSPTDGFDPTYNDVKLPINEKYHTQLLAAGVPPLLANHIAHIFIRDPLVVYRDRLELNDDLDVDHFENIQSSNWQSVRFKPPPHGTSIGWRVEFRTMELMFTDFENAAVVSFICCLS
jgi:glutamate--cysteine ligase catalytic subunit